MSTRRVRLGAPSVRVGYFAALLLALWLSACSVFGPRSVDISATQLQERLDEHFPVSRSVLRVFDITLGAPQITLLPERNRIATTFDLSIGEAWLETPYRGTLGATFGLRYEPRDATVRLADVQVDSLRFAGPAPALQRQLDRIGALLVEQLLEDEPIHRFSPEQVEAVRRSGLEPGAIRVGRSKVSIELQPIAPR